jgi:Zn-dependent protease
MTINVLGLAIVLIVSVTSVILHELAHGLIALALGDQTAKMSGRLTLNPLKHIDPVMSIIVPLMLFLIGAPVFGGAKPVPIDTRNLKWREWGFALVAIAGPLMNFILAFIYFLVGHLSGTIYMSDSLLGTICVLGMYLNIGFMLFNLIPIPPLDGSRVLYALAPEGVRRFMAQMEAYGFIVIYVLILLGGSILSKYMAGGQDAIVQFFYWIVGGR